MPRISRAAGMVVAAGVILAAAVGYQVVQSIPESKSLNADQIKRLVASKEKFIFLDVREAVELQRYGTLAGAVHIPLGQVEARMRELPKDVPIVTACQVGVRAARAAAVLEKNGYQVRGFTGLSEYFQKGYPVVFPKPASASGDARSVTAN